jgi:HK97 family phage prohead protease
MRLNYQSFEAEFKANKRKRVIEGYASTFGNVDLGKDVVVQGAFEKTLQERLPKKQIKMLYGHRDPLGMPVMMKEDSRGLYVEGKVSETQLGNDTLALIEDEVINAMSIGYRTVKHEMDNESGIRYLKELKLYEFSPVVFPMNEEARISGVKSMPGYAGECVKCSGYLLNADGDCATCNEKTERTFIDFGLHKRLSELDEKIKALADSISTLKSEPSKPGQGKPDTTSEKQTPEPSPGNPSGEGKDGDPAPENADVQSLFDAMKELGTALEVSNAARALLQ